jgi:hypothetical protein
MQAPSLPEICVQQFAPQRAHHHISLDHLRLVNLTPSKNEVKMKVKLTRLPNLLIHIIDWLVTLIHNIYSFIHSRDRQHRG